MTKTNLNLYKSFIEVYKNENVSAAAKVLNLTQPTVSYSIKELESQLNVKLFLQRQRGVCPTEAAHTLFPRIQKVLQEITDAEKLVQS